MKRLLPLLAMLLTLSACGKKTIIDDERTFGRDVWNRFTPEVFEFNVSNTEDYYNIDLTVTVDTTLYRYGSLPLTVNLYSPNSERRMFYAEVPLKENDRWRGEMAEGNYRTVSHHIRTFFSFNAKGDHRMEIGQGTSQYDLEGIHSVQLTVETVKLDYSDL